MRILLISTLGQGQLSPLLAIAEELYQRAHDVFVCSADCVKACVDRISSCQRGSGSIRFFSLGSGMAVETPTPYAQSCPGKFRNRARSRARHRPGDLMTFFSLFCGNTSPGNDEYKQAVFRVRDVISECSADMVVVDQFSPPAVDGVRLSGCIFIQTSPGASCTMTRSLSLLSYPLPLSGASGQPSSRKGMRMIKRNVYSILMLHLWASYHPFAKDRRKLRRSDLGLRPVDFIYDSFMTPSPGMIKEMVAAISFNVAGLDLYDAKAFHEQVFFVGPCFPPGTLDAEYGEDCESQHFLSRTADERLIDQDRMEDAGIQSFLEAASFVDGQVIYIDFGSLLYYTASDFLLLVESLTRAHHSRPLLRAIIKIPELPHNKSPLPSLCHTPSFIMTCKRMTSVNDVLKHPAVKIAMHHGGSDSFNEAVYYGLPQLIISQWGDAHDVAANGVCHGIARSVRSAPKFVVSEIVEAIDDLLSNYSTYQATALR